MNDHAQPWTGTGLGGSVGWADPARGAAFGFLHNRFVTRMLFDQASFAGLAPLLRRAVVNADKDGPQPVQSFGAGYSEMLTRSDTSYVRRFRSARVPDPRGDQCLSQRRGSKAFEGV